MRAIIYTSDTLSKGHPVCMSIGCYEAGHSTSIAFTPAEAIAAGRKLIEEAERITMTELAEERARHIAVNQVLPMLRAWYVRPVGEMAA